MGNVLLFHTTETPHYVTNDEKKKTYTYKICDFTTGSIDIPKQRMGSSRVNSKATYAMNTRDTNTKSFEIGWELMVLLIKPHMGNQFTIAGLSSILEESMRVYLDRTREVYPARPNDDKARVC